MMTMKTIVSRMKSISIAIFMLRHPNLQASAGGTDAGRTLARRTKIGQNVPGI
jgi:hypothetical protein